MAKEQFMPCPARGCHYEEWVSPVDQDASFSELWNHVKSRHANYDKDATSALMVKVQVVER